MTYCAIMELAQFLPTADGASALMPLAAEGYEMLKATLEEKAGQDAFEIVQ